MYKLMLKGGQGFGVWKVKVKRKRDKGKRVEKLQEIMGSSLKLVT